VSLEDDISAAVNTIGLDSLGAVWGLGMTSWANPRERDEFLSAVLKME